MISYLKHCKYEKRKLFLILLALFIGDRYLFMDDRTKGLWLWESGIPFGDPISNSQDFEIKNSKLFLKGYKHKEWRPKAEANRNKDLYLLGCYFERLYIYENETNEITLYIMK